jgi:hypothetical protein
MSVETPDLLLELLQRYESERAAFDEEVSDEQISDKEWDRIAEETWSRTQSEILEHQPLAITAVGVGFRSRFCETSIYMAREISLRTNKC